MAELKKIKILLAVTHIDHRNSEKYDTQTEEGIKKQLLAQGYEPTFILRKKKKDIKDAINKDPQIGYAAIMEQADDGTWNENELADLVDERNINLVVVLTNQRRTQPTFLTTLYAAGITSAVFEGNNGVNESEVADLLIHQRSRRKAREYYRIDTKNISIRSLTNEMYNSLTIKLADPENGFNHMDRLLNVAEEVNPYQMADFLEKCPREIVGEFEQYEEYFILINQLRTENKLYVRYRKPKKFKSLNDDKSFNKEAKRALEEAGYDASIYNEPEPETEKKGGLFGLRKKKEKKNEEPAKKVEQPVSIPVSIPISEEEEGSIVGTNDMEFPSYADEEPTSIQIEDEFAEITEIIDAEDIELTVQATPTIPTVAQTPKATQAADDDDDFDPFM